MFQIKSNPNKVLIQRVSLTLFFCLFFSLAFAATPTVGTISPSSGSIPPDVAKTFTTTYSDADGWTNLKEAYLLISTSSTALINSVYLYYDQNTNLLYLRDNANTVWLGGYAPGSNYVIENSQVKLNCAQTTISGSANTLTVNWNITFKSLYSSKRYYTFLRAIDDTGGSTYWTYRGSHTVNYLPQVGTITPSSGTGQVDTLQIFTTTYSDLDGWESIQYVRLLINVLLDGTSCFYGYYNQNTNRLYLRNDSNTIWLGGYAPGSANTIENSFVKLDCSQTTVSGSGTTLTVNWAITFKSPFTGLKNAYPDVVDDVNGYQGGVRKGTWTLPNQAPSVGTITPATGASLPDQPVTFTTTYFDPDTWQNIRYVYFLVNTTISLSNSFFGYYYRDTNQLFMRNDANTYLIGGYSPGSANTIENSYAKLDCSQTTVSGFDNTLTINWAVTFKAPFLGLKNTYLYAVDYAGAYSGWAQKGTWIISSTDTIPPTGTITINNDAQYTNSTLVTLTLSAQDNSGGSGVVQMQFSNDLLNWSGPEAYTTTTTWTFVSNAMDCTGKRRIILPGTITIPNCIPVMNDGQKRIYVKFKDVAGNWSEPISDTIILDTTPPTISINPVISPTNQNINLSYAVSDNFAPTNEILVTGDNSPYTNEGNYTVTLTAQDLAGNSASDSVSFSIDKTQPQVIITSPQNGAVVGDSQIQLQGTIDGEAFSEARSLVEGENILTKTAFDSAGNSGSASVTVYLYSGILIGPGGGEVISSDGRIKLIVPAGALDAPTSIRILPVDNQTLQSATPEGLSLLAAVEGRPSGLIFNKPASLIYTLAQAEIPGTPVELGRYDSLQNKLIPTGQTSIVPADGYTLNFSITSFSTYAALKNLTPQNIPIGAGVKVPLPDLLTGAFSHAIPITVPPGRKGMQPGLGLVYRSSNPNSWVGLGFNLNPGYIVRSTRLGPPTYIDTQDTFYLVTDAGTTELVNLIDNLYQAKVESNFARFLKENDDSWKVVGKDGSVLRFGTTSDAKEGSSLGTFSWYLTKAVDTNGNFIEYSYTKDQGKSYLSRIDYTGNEIGVSPTNTVEFYLEPRDDITLSYISSAKISTAKRLKEIQAKVNYDLVWRYELQYTYSQDTNRSLLKSIKQLAADGQAFPEQKFSYQAAK